MLTAEIRYHFNAADLENLKQAAALHLQNIAPSQRLELLARFCGFATLAGFRTTLIASGEEEPTLDLEPERAAAFAAERGLAFDALDMHHTLASAAYIKVARAWPKLHNWGYGTNCLHPNTKDYREMMQGVPLEERWPRLQRVIAEDLAERREALLQMREAEGFLRSLAYASLMTKIKTSNDRRTSYGLKHTAEKMAFTLQGDAFLKAFYVTNTDMIAALLYAGFTPDDRDYIRGQFNNCPNPCFNISQRSLKAIEEQSRQARLVA